MQRLQHQTVAAECDDDIGLLGIGIAIALLKSAIGLARFRRMACDKGDMLKSLAHKGTCRWNARYSSIRLGHRLSRRSAPGARSLSAGWPPALTSCREWYRITGGGAKSNGRKRSSCS